MSSHTESTSLNEPTLIQQPVDMTPRTAYFLKLRQEREERLKKEHQNKVVLYLQHVEDPELVAGKVVRIYPDHPSGLATGESRGWDLFIPDHWWDCLPDKHPLLTRLGWREDSTDSVQPIQPETEKTPILSSHSFDAHSNLAPRIQPEGRKDNGSSYLSQEAQRQE